MDGSQTLAGFRAKFRVDELLVAKTPAWSWSVRPGQATLINEMLKAMGTTSAEIGGRRYYAKPLHVLRPKGLESMTISLKDSSAQKRYFELGQQAAATLFKTA